MLVEKKYINTSFSVLSIYYAFFKIFVLRIFCTRLFYPHVTYVCIACSYFAILLKKRKQPQLNNQLAIVHNPSRKLITQKKNCPLFAPTIEQSHNQIIKFKSNSPSTTSSKKREPCSNNIQNQLVNGSKDSRTVYNKARKLERALRAWRAMLADYSQVPWLYLIFIADIHTAVRSIHMCEGSLKQIKLPLIHPRGGAALHNSRGRDERVSSNAPSAHRRVYHGFTCELILYSQASAYIAAFMKLIWNEAAACTRLGNHIFRSVGFPGGWFS